MQPQNAQTNIFPTTLRQWAEIVLYLIGIAIFTQLGVSATAIAKHVACMAAEGSAVGGVLYSLMCLASFILVEWGIRTLHTQRQRRLTLDSFIAMMSYAISVTSMTIGIFHFVYLTVMEWL